MLRQMFGNGIGGVAFHKQSVDGANCFGFLRYDLRQSVRSLAIAEELLVGHADLAIREPFSLAPCDILGNAAALLLCQAGHDGDQQLALTIQGVDVLFFKVDLYTFFF